MAREGPAAAAWLAELPGIVAELLECWDCVPDGELMYGGVGIVVPVRRPTTEAAVIKVSFPHPGNVHEPDALATWAGRGAVLLHERDDGRFAMLLERAHPVMLATIENNDAVIEVAGRLNHRLAVPAPEGLPRLSERADAWETQLRTDAAELSHPLPRTTVDAAVATVRELGQHQPETLVHGDLIARNILHADREPWLAVDPKGQVGDPAYDVGPLLKSRSPALLEVDDLRRAVHRILDVFAEAAEVDRERVQRWAQLHILRAAFHGRRHGFRRARSGPMLDRLTTFLDGLAMLLTEPARQRSPWP